MLMCDLPAGKKSRTQIDWVALVICLCKSMENVSTLCFV